VITEPKCRIRKRKHYLGLKQIGPETELEDEGLYNVCVAFPDGIPDEIAYGDNPHSEPLPGQGNEIVYERLLMGERGFSS